MDTETLLPEDQGVMRQQINFLDLFISHGVTALGRAVAVYHNGTAGSVPGRVKVIGVADVKGEMIAAFWIELFSVDGIESLWTLPVALIEFGSGVAGIVADMVVGKVLKTVVFQHPHLQGAAHFEDAHEDRQAELEPLCCQFFLHPGLSQGHEYLCFRHN